jgi:hypothetical protein
MLAVAAGLGTYLTRLTSRTVMSDVDIAREIRYGCLMPALPRSTRAGRSGVLVVPGSIRWSARADEAVSQAKPVMMSARLNRRRGGPAAMPSERKWGMYQGERSGGRVA